MLKMWSVNLCWAYNMQIFTKYPNRFIETCILEVLCSKFSSIWDRQALKSWENVNGFLDQRTRSKWSLHKWKTHIYNGFFLFFFNSSWRVYDPIFEEILQCKPHSLQIPKLIDTIQLAYRSSSRWHMLTSSRTELLILDFITDWLWKSLEMEIFFFSFFSGKQNSLHLEICQTRQSLQNKI